jgi:hypothetical protein
MGHALIENRNGLVVGAVATRASGHAERLAALALIEPDADRQRPVTLGRRQRLRQQRLRHGVARVGGHPAPRREPERAALGDRPAHHSPSRLRGLAAYPQAH